MPIVYLTGMGSRQFCRGRGRGRGRELDAEARQTKFEARPRRGDP